MRIGWGAMSLPPYFTTNEEKDSLMTGIIAALAKRTKMKLTLMKIP